MKRLIKSYTRRDILKTGAVSALTLNFFPARVFGANTVRVGAGRPGIENAKLTRTGISFSLAHCA